MHSHARTQPRECLPSNRACPSKLSEGTVALVIFSDMASEESLVTVLSILSKGHCVFLQAGRKQGRRWDVSEPSPLLPLLPLLRINPV